MLFEDRSEAAKLLAQKLSGYRGKDCIILAIPRGGIEVGYWISRELKIRMDIVIAKKIGAPGNEELAIGSVGPGKTMFLNKEIIGMHEIPENYIEEEKERISKIIEEKYKLYRGSKELPDIKNRIVIITDDGIATGATIIAAVQYVKTQKPKKTIIAVPVCAEETLAELKEMVDEVIYLSTNLMMGAVGACYKYFPQISDEQVIKYLKSKQLKG